MPRVLFEYHPKKFAAKGRIKVPGNSAGIDPHIFQIQNEMNSIFQELHLAA